MTSPRPASTTTEEHRPPSDPTTDISRPVLLGAFPVPIAVSLPPPGEIVGRAWLADAGLRDTEVSSDHLRFSYADGHLYVEDAGSRNGTWLSGARLPSRRRAPLEDGAVLRIGRTILVYRAGFDRALSPAPALGRLVGPWGLGAVRARLEELSRRPARAVLIEGAHGTGKEIAAAAVIQALGRAKMPYVALHVAGVSGAQLFGWARGEGIFRENHGGAVFLDDIGELPLDLQAKLLRALEHQEVLPVGASRHVPVDVVVIAATDRPLEDAMDRGAFRRDLRAQFTTRLALPTLADRREDIYAILAALAERRGLRIDASLADVEAIERLVLAAWPANVRDLDHMVAALAPALTRAHALTLPAVEAALRARTPRGEHGRRRSGW